MRTNWQKSAILAAFRAERSAVQPVQLVPELLRGNAYPPSSALPLWQAVLPVRPLPHSERRHLRRGEVRKLEALGCAILNQSLGCDGR